MGLLRGLAGWILAARCSLVGSLASWFLPMFLPLSCLPPLLLLSFFPVPLAFWCCFGSLLHVLAYFLPPFVLFPPCLSLSRVGILLCSMLLLISVSLRSPSSSFLCLWYCSFALFPNIVLAVSCLSPLYSFFCLSGIGLGLCSSMFSPVSLSPVVLFLPSLDL